MDPFRESSPLGSQGHEVTLSRLSYQTIPTYYYFVHFSFSITTKLENV